MRWIEVCINTPREEIDARCEELAALGAGGFVIENEDDFREFLENNHQYWDYVDKELSDSFSGVSRIKTYLADDEDGRAILAAIRNAYGAVSVCFVEDSDWENNWREYYKPIEIGKKLVVVPEWEEIPAGGRIPLRLDPGLLRPVLGLLAGALRLGLGLGGPVRGGVRAGVLAGAGLLAGAAGGIHFKIAPGFLPGGRIHADLGQDAPALENGQHQTDGPGGQETADDDKCPDEIAAFFSFAVLTFVHNKPLSRNRCIGF